MLDYKPLFDVGEGEPIILLGGLIGKLSNWGRVAYEFTSSHRILIPRIPFYQIPISHTRLNDLITYLEEFVEAHSLDKVTVIGYSLGGHVALLYTWRNPSKVKKLVVASISGFFENHEEHSLLEETDVELNLGITHHAIYKGEIAANENAVERFQKVDDKSNILNRKRLALSPQHYSECSILHNIYAPTLLVWGLKDTHTSPEVALAFQEHLPNSKIVFLDQCGHVPMVDQPKLFNQHVREFLER